MRRKYLIFVFVCLVLAPIPATSKMFVLENYTIDTGAYGTPYPEVIDHDTLAWSWNDNKRTVISIAHATVDLKNPELNNISYKNYTTHYMQTSLMDAIADFDGITLNTDDENLTEYWRNLSTASVNKPYPGYIAIPSSDPTLKMYIGLIGRVDYLDFVNDDYLVIISNEDDEMVSFIMSELKIYTKAQSNTARLQAIQKRL